FGSLTSFLQGTISTFTVVPSPTALGWRSLEAAGFVQDAIKLRPNLDVSVGLAWDPFSRGRTVIHAGFGIHRALLDNLDYRLDQTAPFNTTESLKNVPVAGLQIVPGKALPAGTKISPSGAQPDLYTPTVITWTFK